jgi:hypothetical protein
MGDSLYLNVTNKNKDFFVIKTCFDVNVLYKNTGSLVEHYVNSKISNLNYTLSSRIFYIAEGSLALNDPKIKDLDVVICYNKNGYITLYGTHLFFSGYNVMKICGIIFDLNEQLILSPKGSNAPEPNILRLFLRTVFVSNPLLRLSSSLDCTQHTNRLYNGSFKVVQPSKISIMNNILKVIRKGFVGEKKRKNQPYIQCISTQGYMAQSSSNNSIGLSQFTYPSDRDLLDTEFEGILKEENGFSLISNKTFVLCDNLCKRTPPIVGNVISELACFYKTCLDISFTFSYADFDDKYNINNVLVGSNFPYTYPMYINVLVDVGNMMAYVNMSVCSDKIDVEKITQAFPGKLDLVEQINI